MKHENKMKVQTIIALVCDILLIPVSVLLYYHLGEIEFCIVVLVLLFLAIANSILTMSMYGDHIKASPASFCRVKFKTFLTLYGFDHDSCVLKPTVVYARIERPGGYKYIILYFSKLDTLCYLFWRLKKYRWRDSDEYEIMRDIRKYIAYKTNEEKQSMEDNTDEYENN